MKYLKWFQASFVACQRVFISFRPIFAHPPLKIRCSKQSNSSTHSSREATAIFEILIFWKLLHTNHRWASSFRPWEGVHFFFRQRGVNFFKTGRGQGGSPGKKFPRIFKECHSCRKTAPKIDITNLLQKCNVFFTKLWFPCLLYLVTFNELRLWRKF